MPKLKTHKGLAKRVKVSPNGKIKRKKAFFRLADLFANHTMRCQFLLIPDIIKTKGRPVWIAPCKGCEDRLTILQSLC